MTVFGADGLPRLATHVGSWRVLDALPNENQVLMIKEGSNKVYTKPSTTRQQAILDAKRHYGKTQKEIAAAIVSNAAAMAAAKKESTLEQIGITNIICV